jgi:hypothetical protein
MRTTYPSANARKNATYISGLLQVYHRLEGSDLGLVLKYYAAAGDELRVALHEVSFDRRSRADSRGVAKRTQGIGVRCHHFGGLGLPWGADFD